MPLADVCTIYARARNGGYAVGGFCAEHLDMVMAIIEAAEEMKSPVVIFLYEGDIELAGPGMLEAVVKEAGTKASVPVGLHLDHGASLKDCLLAAANGHTGVMIDASHSSYEKNVETTRRVVDVCHELDVLVEGEIGTIPRNFERTGVYASPKKLTDPDEAADYVERTGIDCLAVSIGEESGMTSPDVKLDVPRLKAIARKTDVYLSMHGGSGTPPDQIRAVVREGIVSIRFATEMRLAFFNALERERVLRGQTYPLSHELLKPAREAAKALIKVRMSQLGSSMQACTDGLCPPVYSMTADTPSNTPSNMEITAIVEMVEAELTGHQRTN